MLASGTLLPFQRLADSRKYAPTSNLLYVHVPVPNATLLPTNFQNSTERKIENQAVNPTPTKQPTRFNTILSVFHCTSCPLLRDKCPAECRLVYLAGKSTQALSCSRPNL